MASESGLELPIGLTEQKFMQQLARIEAQSIKTSQRAEAAFKRSNQASANSFKALERSAGASLRNMSGLFRAGAGLLAGGLVANQLRQYTRLADAATRMQNSLRVVGLEGAELSAVYEQLYRSAQKNSAPINSLVDLYSKLALTQKELGVSSKELIEFTDGIAVALRVGGTDAQAASGSLLQLSQALGGGTVRAEEFNSILEGTPTIAQAMARGLKEAGGSVAELRKIVVAGELSSKAAFEAFVVGSEELRVQAESSQTTVGQAFTRIGNSLVTVVGEFDQASGASANFANVMIDMADGLDSFDAASFVSEVRAIINALLDAEAAATSWLNSLGNAQIFADLNEFMGVTDENGMIINPDVREAEAKIALLEKEIEALQAQIANNTELGFDNTLAISRLQEVRAELAALRAEAANMPRTVAGINMRDGSPIYSMTDTGSFYDGSNYSPPPAAPAKREPVSIQQYPAAPSRPASGGGGRRRSGGGGGGGGRSGQAAPDALVLGADEIRDLERQIQLIGLSTKEAAKLQAQWTMLDEAKKAGVPINDELNAKIQQQAAEFGELTEQLERAEIGQQRFEEAVDGIADAFAGALVAGDSLREGLANVLKQIAADILTSGIRRNLMNVFGGTGLFQMFMGGGDRLTGALRIAGAFDKGGYTGDGGKLEPAGVVHRGEYVMDADTVRRAGGPAAFDALRRGLKGYANGGYVGAPVIPSMARQQEPRVVYVPQPYVADLSASDDGQMVARFRKVASDEVSRSAPSIVGQSVQASGRAMSSTKAFGGRM